MSAILVINSGSSSLKAAVWQTDPARCLATALAERLGTHGAILTWKHTERHQEKTHDLGHGSHEQALRQLLADWQEQHLLTEVEAVGHRIVHGGELFHEATQLDGKSIEEIAAVSHLAPLHNPANLAGIAAAQAVLSDLPHVGVFDTAFHQSMPAQAYRYAVPQKWYEEHAVRKYGFHGTSHRWVSEQAAEILGLTGKDHGIVTAHLGNGCSVTAIRNGKSVDTNMGLTPLAGTVMGTRSGSIDPGIIGHVAKQTGASLAEIMTTLNTESGLLGLSGTSNDMRTLSHDASLGHDAAQLAIDVFCYRLAQEISAMATALPEIHALVFTGGIGENAAAIRQQVVEHLRVLGLTINATANNSNGAEHNLHIESTSSRAAVLVVPTNEELQIARETAALVTYA